MLPQTSKCILQWSRWLCLHWLFYSIILFHRWKENNDMLPTKFPSCSDLSKRNKTCFSTFPEQLNVLYCVVFSYTKTENLGQKKKIYSLPTVLLYENWTTVAKSPGFTTHSTCIEFPLYHNSLLFLRMEFFQSAHSQKKKREDSFSTWPCQKHFALWTRLDIDLSPIFK